MIHLPVRIAGHCATTVLARFTPKAGLSEATRQVPHRVPHEVGNENEMNAVSNQTQAKDDGLQGMCGATLYDQLDGGVAWVNRTQTRGSAALRNSERSIRLWLSEAR